MNDRKGLTPLTESATTPEPDLQSGPNRLDRPPAAPTLMSHAGGKPPLTTLVGDLTGLDEAPRRTLFRRATGGSLREEGVPDPVPAQSPRADGRPADSERYAFVGLVGEGAMGRIHLADEKQLLRQVAYKEMADEVAFQPALASKFKLEARITAQLDHPNIVPVYSLESQKSYTMKLIRGTTLEDLLAQWRASTRDTKTKRPILPLRQRLEQFLQVCDAIRYAHSRGVIHRDLKPENIMIGAYDEVYVMDWGIARVVDPTVPQPVRLGDVAPQEEGELIIGTPGYMSPEQADGRNDDLDGASDQYALGLVLHEIISLRRAVTGKAPLKIVMRHQDGERDPLTSLGGEPIAPELAAIVAKACALRKGQRYASVRDLAEDLRRYLRGEEVAARRDSLIRKLQRMIARHPMALMATTLMLVFGTIGSAGLLFGVSRLEVAAAEAREKRVSNLLTTVAHQSSLIDGQFLKYEGLLSLIAATSIDALESPARSDAAGLLLADFSEAARSAEGGQVADLQPSDRYGMPISLAHPVFATAPGVDPTKVAGQMAQLGALRNHQYRILLRSHSERAATYTPERARRAISEVGVPVTWTYVGLESGLFESYPGHGGLPADFDARRAPWYALAKDTHGPTWGAPAADPSGVGLVLSCAQSLHDAEERLLGVAGIDVSFDFLIAELLEAPEFSQVSGVEFFLLDPEGRIAVRSSSKGKNGKAAIENRELRMPSFPDQEVVRAVKEKRTGVLETADPQLAGGRHLVVYNRMGSIGWYYVLSGPAEALLRFDD